jgi:hypothetical protein
LAYAAGPSHQGTEDGSAASRQGSEIAPTSVRQDRPLTHAPAGREACTPRRPRRAPAARCRGVRNAVCACTGQPQLQHTAFRT